jgi:hypothetical protein
MATASVYVIGTTRMVKIGWSDDPLQRRATFQMGSPVKLGVYLMMTLPSREHARALESWAHRLLARDRAHGEWFKLSPDEAIRAIVQGMQELGYQGTTAYRSPPRPSIRVVMEDGSKTVPTPIAGCG